MNHALLCKTLFGFESAVAVSSEGEQRLARELACRVAELARSPRMAKVKQRWRDVLACRPTDRPPVWCNPVSCWRELLPASDLVCKDPVCREIEVYCKRLLIKHEIGDDTPVNEYYKVTALFDVSPPHIWGLTLERERVRDGGVGTAWRYRPALNQIQDYERLISPKYTINRKATGDALSQRSEILEEKQWPWRTS